MAVNKELKQLLERKKQIQSAKNVLKVMEGIECLEFYEKDEKEGLNELFQEYYPIMCSAHTLPCSKISYYSSEKEIYDWIIKELDLKEEKEYFFLCKRIWTKIKIIDLQSAVKSLWRQGEVGRSGFLIAENDLSRIMEAGCDSRDEEHYLIDIYYAKTVI